jgi:putative hydrolase of the HAD superfamily
MLRFDDIMVVLDLDDTLYKEVEYVLSGIRAVTNQINSIYGSALSTELVDAYLGGDRDVWGLACSILRLPTQTKDSFLWMYRLHLPAIGLRPHVVRWINDLQQAGTQLAILTDGRSVSQRLKLASLGLADLPVYISEEHGSEKPSPERFISIMKRWPGKRYAYIGDNARKDFVAPNHLGWLTVGLVDDGTNIHPQRKDVEAEYAPKYWVENLEQVDEYLREWIGAEPTTALTKIPVSDSHTFN